MAFIWATSTLNSLTRLNLQLTALWGCTEAQRYFDLHANISSGGISDHSVEINYHAVKMLTYKYLN